MLTLIIGGSGSGKSEFAEILTEGFPGPRIYLATMAAADAESRRRILRHRTQRAGRGFLTLECPQNIAAAEIPKGASVLLEDLSNLLANELFMPNGGGEDAVREGLQALLKKCDNLVIVTNEVFSGGCNYGEESLRFLQMLADLNCRIAKEAELVAGVVCALPNVLKGELPCRS